MDFNERTVDQLEARQIEIAGLIDNPEANLDELENEARAIKAELEKLIEESEEMTKEASEAFEQIMLLHNQYQKIVHLFTILLVTMVYSIVWM